MEKPRILVVDDEREARELLKDFLEAKGYAVVTASNGAEALTAVQEHRPHLILLDIMMPGMNGLKVLRRIREIDRNVGVLMLTAVSDSYIARQAMYEGAYDYLTKPLNLAYLELSILTGLAQQDRPRSGHPGVGDAEAGCQEEGL